MSDNYINISKAKIRKSMQKIEIFINIILEKAEIILFQEISNNDKRCN